MSSYKPTAYGFTSIPVLEFLNGRVYDEVVRNYIHALRPRSVRVIKHNMDTKTDAWVWRVTVYLTKDNTIEKISQEVEVGLEGGFHSGHDLDTHLRTGKPERINGVIINPRYAEWNF